MLSNIHVYNLSVCVDGSVTVYCLYDMVQEASAMLANSSLSCEITEWLHSAIIKTFLHAGRHQLALKFITTVNLPMLTTADVELRVTVLLANGYSLSE